MLLARTRSDDDDTHYAAFLSSKAGANNLLFDRVDGSRAEIVRGSFVARTAAACGNYLGLRACV